MYYSVLSYNKKNGYLRLVDVFENRDVADAICKSLIEDSKVKMRFWVEECCSLDVRNYASYNLIDSVRCVRDCLYLADRSILKNKFDLAHYWQMRAIAVASNSVGFLKF